MTEPQAPPMTRRRLRKLAGGIVALGFLVQLLLSAYYLGVGHAPRPRDLPVGFVAPTAQHAELKALIERGGSFDARAFADGEKLRRAIETKDVYGGVDASAPLPHLYVASAAGPTASNTIRAAFTAVVEQRIGQRVAEITKVGKPVPPEVLARLTTPPQITDVAPLPPDDRTGGAIGLLVQALALGATLASLGLGRLAPHTRPSLRRGIAHTTTLVVYAVASAAAVIGAAAVFGVVDGSTATHVYLYCLLLSLAITASTAGFVALFGPLGSLMGGAYFTLGLIISGSSILPEFLPGFGRAIGQSIPTGAGVTAIRNGLYFPDAPVTGPLVVLAIYAGFGMAVVLVRNARAS